MGRSGYCYTTHIMAMKALLMSLFTSFCFIVNIQHVNKNLFKNGWQRCLKIQYQVFFTLKSMKLSSWS